MNDQDKHEMRLLQELYLEDEFGGSEKRRRNFRWRNIDENFNVGATNGENNLNEDVDEADNYSELKERNLELVERNKYLLELEEVNFFSHFPFHFQKTSKNNERFSFLEDNGSPLVFNTASLFQNSNFDFNCKRFF